MKTYTFDEICESQDFDHDHKFVNESDLADLKQRVMDAEKAMAKAYAWPNDGDPRTDHVKMSFREYREKYPYALV